MQLLQNEELDTYDYIAKAMEALKKLDPEAEICAGSVNMNKFNEGIQYAIDLLDSYRRSNGYGAQFPDIRLHAYVNQLKSRKE